MNLPEEVGRLRPLETGYWGIVYETGLRDELHPGDEIYLESRDGKFMAPTRIEYDNGNSRFYSSDGYELREGAKASKGGMGLFGL